MASKTNSLLPLKLAGWMCAGIGAVLLGFMLWISTWPRDGAGTGAAFATPLLPGHRFMPEILPRLGEIGGAALGIGLTLLIVAAFAARRRGAQ